MPTNINTIKEFCKLQNVKSVLQTKPQRVNLKTLKYDTFAKSEPIEKNFTQEEIKKTIYTYVKSSFINEVLRKNYPIDKGYQAIIDKMDYAIKTAKPSEEPIKVYRGLQAPKAGISEDVVEKFLNENPGYTSTAVDTYIANLFKDTMRQKGALIEITIPKDSKFITTDKERILPRNAKFDIQKIDEYNYTANYLPPKE